MDIVKIGKNLKKARKAKNLKQIELAEKVGLHPNYYSRVERGEEKAALETLEKIFKVLKVKSSEILPF